MNNKKRKLTLKQAVFELMDKYGYVSDQRIVTMMGNLNFSFKTVQNYMYEYNRKKRGDKL